MNITKLNIISFGKLKNVVIEPSHLTVIYGENGAGKSTVAAFIRLMLFGPKSGRGLNDRNRYLPWSGGFMEGELYFSHDGTEYAVHRIMGKSAREDRCTVVNALTGKKVARKPADIIGAELSLLECTAYIAQDGTIFPDGTDLGAALRETVMGGGADSERAFKILDEKRRLISNPRSKNRGSLDLVNARLDDAQSRRAVLVSRKNEIEKRRKYVEELENSYELAQERLMTVSAENPEEGLEPVDDDKYDKRARLILEFVVLVFVAALSAYSVMASGDRLPWLAFALLVITVLVCVVDCVRFALAKAKKKTAIAEREAELLRRETELENKKTAAKEDLSAAAADLFAAREELKAVEEISVETLDNEISALKAERAELSAQLDNINAAERGIRRALELLGEGFLPNLAKAVSENFCLLSGENAEVLIDSSLRISLSRDGVRESERFSAGIRDMLYLSLRLAAAQMLFPEAPPPLVLDDPFVRYDRRREGNAVDMLVKLSNKYQIIVFTCKNPKVFSENKFNVLTI